MAQTKTYRVVSPITMGATKAEVKTYKPGDTIELDAATAKSIPWAIEREKAAPQAEAEKK